MHHRRGAAVPGRDGQPAFCAGTAPLGTGGAGGAPCSSPASVPFAYCPAVSHSGPAFWYSEFLRQGTMRFRQSKYSGRSRGLSYSLNTCGPCHANAMGCGVTREVGFVWRGGGGSAAPQEQETDVRGRECGLGVSATAWWWVMGAGRGGKQGTASKLAEAEQKAEEEGAGTGRHRPAGAVETRLTPMRLPLQRGVTTTTTTTTHLVVVLQDVQQAAAAQLRRRKLLAVLKGGHHLRTEAGEAGEAGGVGGWAGGWVKVRSQSPRGGTSATRARQQEELMPLPRLSVCANTHSTMQSARLAEEDRRRGVGLGLRAADARRKDGPAS